MRNRIRSGPDDELKLLEGLEQRKLEEQDEYCEIIRCAEAAGNAETVSARIRELGWQGVLELMSGLRSPPCAADWKQCLGRDWDAVPKRRKLEAVEDQELARGIYFYSEIAEHTERIKAMAHFAQGIGMVGPHGARVFRIWERGAVVRELLLEERQLDSPEGDGVQWLETMSDVLNRMGEALCEDPESVAEMGGVLERLMEDVEPSV